MTSKNLVVFQHKATQSLREALMTILRDYPRPLMLRDVDGELYHLPNGFMPGNELWSALELYSMWQEGIVYMTVDHSGGVDYDEGFVLVSRVTENAIEQLSMCPPSPRKGFWLLKLDEQGRRVDVATNEVMTWDQ